MVDVNIKQVRLSFSDLPDINSNLGGYILRYRIVSEDKNRVSQWSPIFIAQPGYSFVPGNLVVETGSVSASVVWNAVSIQKNFSEITKAASYDLWARWHNSDAGDWVYVDRVTGTTYTLLLPNDYTINGVSQGTTPSFLDIEIYLRGFPIQRGSGVPLDPGSPFLKVYESIDNVVATSS
jgi:hypothetical protein